MGKLQKTFRWKTSLQTMLATAIICILCILFQPLCVKLMKIPVEQLEVSGNSLFVENNLHSIVSALFIHDGLSHSLYNILTTIPIIYSLETHFDVSYLLILLVILLCGIIGFISSIYYTKYKYDGNIVYLFIPHCGFSHAMYGITLFSCFLFPNNEDYLPSNIFGIHPIIWILIAYIVPDFFVTTPKHSKKFWLLMSYFFLIICWAFDNVFLKNKLYYRICLGLPPMCDHFGHLFGMISGLIIGFIYTLFIVHQFDFFMTIKHSINVFYQWPLCFTLLFALYRVKVNW